MRIAIRCTLSEVPFRGLGVRIAVAAFDVDVLEFSVHEIRVTCFELIMMQIY